MVLPVLSSSGEQVYNACIEAVSTVLTLTRLAWHASGNFSLVEVSGRVTCTMNEY